MTSVVEPRAEHEAQRHIAQQIELAAHAVAACRRQRLIHQLRQVFVVGPVGVGVVAGTLDKRPPARALCARRY